MNIESTFSARYCARHGLQSTEFEVVVLREALYPHARWLAPLIRVVWPNHFAADEEFVQNVGRLTRIREFVHDAEEFAHHPANRGFWRSIMHVRVSARKLRRIVRETIRSEPSGVENGSA